MSIICNEGSVTEAVDLNLISFLLFWPNLHNNFLLISYLSPMDSDFILPVEFGGEVLQLRARIVQTSYLVKLEVEMEDTIVTFEPDEERNWRAVLGYDDLIIGKKVKQELVQAVAKFIETITQ